MLKRYGGNRMVHPTTWYDNVFRFRFVLSREASSIAMPFFPLLFFSLISIPYPSSHHSTHRNCYRYNNTTKTQRVKIR